MKPTITLSAIALLAVLALAGCNQNTPDNSTATPGANSSMNGAGGGGANLPATNSLPEAQPNVTATNQ